MQARTQSSHRTAQRLVGLLNPLSHTATPANLGASYSNGEGVPQDYLRAHKWINLAASRATGDDLKKYADGRETVAAKMTSEQIAEAQRLAREWKPKTWDELKE